jgi:antitoxin component of MazEF toxin-antitoxin module
MKTNVKQAIYSIENLLRDGSLYYSSIQNAYFMAFHGGLGNFELHKLPRAWTGLFVNREVEPESLSVAVTGCLKLDARTTYDAEDQVVQISKVLSAELYGELHDETLTSALLFTSKHHQHQTRKASGEPYLNHLLEVLQTLTHFEPACDENIKIAAVLHDIVEDTPVTIESVDFLFGSKVASIISELTCNSAANSDDKKAALLAQIKMGSMEAKVIKLADVISNVTLLPQDWSIERITAYVEWCKKVVDVCAAASPRLQERFNSFVENVHLQVLVKKQKPSWVSFSSVEPFTPEEIKAQLQIDEENESIGKLVAQMDRETMSMPIDIVTVPNKVKVTTLRHQLSVLLPSNVIADLDLNEGDEVEFCVGDAIITFHKIQSKFKSKQDSILLIVRKWCRSDREALDWYNHEEIPAFKMTPREAVERGCYIELINYLESIALGGFA